MNDRFDVAIIGAGLAGLAAAYSLRDKKTILLERENRAGGRVETRQAKGFTYELGSIFPYPRELVPFEFESSAIVPESGPLGVSLAGNLTCGSTVAECLKNLGCNDPIEMAEFFGREVAQASSESQLSFLDLLTGKPGSDTAGKSLCHRILSSFFRVIHPGRPELYLPQRRLDALSRFDVSHHRGGNGELVEAFLSRLPQKPVLEAAVTAIVEEEEGFRISFDRNGSPERVTARSVIVTTPAPVTARLVPGLGEESKRTLSGIRFGPGTAVVIGLKGCAIREFAYIVTPDQPFNTVIRHGGFAQDMVLLTIYYVGEASKKLREQPVAATIGETVARLGKLGIGEVDPGKVVMSDLKHWDMIGPRITPQAYGEWNDRILNPIEGLFLAGDSMFVDPADLFPYGMDAALLSGKRGGEAAREFLSEGAKRSPQTEVPQRGFRPEPLTVCHIYRCTPREPLFENVNEEGDIAFYGLILQSERNGIGEKYLLAVARDHLWEYHHGYGVTAADSAFVIEGLWANGTPVETLIPSLRAVVGKFFCREEGGFKTVLEGRAPYWRGVSVETTAHLAYLLQKIAPAEFAAELEACAAYLKSRQDENGAWTGKWYPNPTIPVYFALRFLAAFDSERFSDQIRKGRNCLVRWAGPRGDWFGSVISTAAALLALKALGDTAMVVENGIEWLRSRQSGGRWPGEPVLYYWMDDGEDRIFYSCHDKGRITTAWARLALEE